MNEGWYADECLILFVETDISTVADRYAISLSLPGYQILGLRSWDDFIVRDPMLRVYTVPTIPMDSQYLSPFILPEPGSVLGPDARFAGK